MRRSYPVLLLLAMLPAAHAANPSLLRVDTAPVRALLATPARTPVLLDENAALAAMQDGGLWLDSPTGGRSYVRYVRHETFPNGDWTWIGSVDTQHGPQSVVLTFGAHASFGNIPQATGASLRVYTDRSGSWLMAPATQSRLRQRALGPGRNDARIPPRDARKASFATAGMSLAAQQAAISPPTSPPTGTTLVDVLVAYTPDMVQQLGSTDNVLTRIHYLISYANQAYANSQVDMRVRLARAVPVDYTAATSNEQALDDLTTVGGTTALEPLHALRDRYGADLVALLRHFDNARDGSCGNGWLSGGDGTSITDHYDFSAGYGFSVVSDGSDESGYYCEDKSFTHELGHNMGLAHDVDNADGTGAYPYAYGYKKTVGSGGFGTIMAYEDAGQDSTQVFSSPQLTICQNFPCGVQNQADNARALRQTDWLIGGFRHNRIAPFNADGDTTSDLLWHNPNDGRMVYWPMLGAGHDGYRNQSVSTSLRLLGTGDFNGDGFVDLLWADSSRRMTIWLGGRNAGKSDYVASSFGTYNSNDWYLAGIGDVDGDGKDDLVWHNQVQGTLAYWLMDGSSRKSARSIGVNKAYRVLGVGDFNGDGLVDVLWGNAQRTMYVWLGNGSTFSINAFGTYNAGGWKLKGTGDVDGDGKDDLLWYNQSLGTFAYWTMNGASRKGTKSFKVNAAYDVLATGDFDGNGMVDIMWGNASRVLYAWLGNGSTFDVQAAGSYSTGGWKAINRKGVTDADMATP
ncbi:MULTISPECIES: reprolysin-like metallopeptidase [Rhodanobacter]|nr:FG-GAP-like repeat-containing protein [Rhodanobacter spathiphylli]